MSQFQGDKKPAECVLFSTGQLGESALSAFNEFAAGEQTNQVPALLLLGPNHHDWTGKARPDLRPAPTGTVDADCDQGPARYGRQAAAFSASGVKHNERQYGTWAPSEDDLMRSGGWFPFVIGAFLVASVSAIADDPDDDLRRDRRGNRATRRPYRSRRGTTGARS